MINQGSSWSAESFIEEPMEAFSKRIQSNLKVWSVYWAKLLYFSKDRAY